MTRTHALAVSTAALCSLCLLPRAARADWGIRAGLEAPIASHVNSVGSYSIGDSFQPALDILVQKGPNDFIAFGLEGHIGFASTGAGYSRTGESIGPEMMINIPVLPLYASAELPIRIDPNGPAVGLRIAAGFKFSVPFVGIYLEAAADLPLAGNDPGGASVNAFSEQVFSVGAGVQLAF